MKIRHIIFTLLFLAACYGGSRLYFRVTDGFLVSNITSNFPYREEWQTKKVPQETEEQVKQILSSKFQYLGKGCQSYVFKSEDDQYVLKFVKYQRFRPQPWIHWMHNLPLLNGYAAKKIQKRDKKLHMLFDSWKTAFNLLAEETGLVYVHLNKTDHLKQKIIIFDKLGFEHHLDADQMEFLIQKKASLLCSQIERLMAKDNENDARKLLTNLLNLIMSEYERGYADNDHALMQNTGVVGLNPVHIDVGQFVVNAEIKNPEVYKQELFSKTFKFRKWLNKKYPTLGSFFEQELYTIIGDDMQRLKPQVKNHAWSVE